MLTGLSKTYKQKQYKTVNKLDAFADHSPRLVSYRAFRISEVRMEALRWRVHQKNTIMFH